MAEAIIAWLPLLALVALFLSLVARSQKSYKRHVDEVNAVNQQIVDTNREMIAELREIKELLKDPN